MYSPEKYTFEKVYSHFNELAQERSDWESEWRNVSDYLVPGRGIYQTYSKPRKRQLTSPRVINSIAEDALYVLTSGMHGGLTSPSRPWFKLGWADPRLNNVEPLKAWLQDCDKKLHAELHKSNFYSITNSYYIEYAGFGTGSTYVGEDTGTDDVAFRFELLTAGEFYISSGADGRPSTYMRTIFRTPRKLVEQFPNTVSEELRKKVERNESGIDSRYVTILEAVYRDNFQGKKYVQMYWEVSSEAMDPSTSGEKKPLGVKGFHEFPYPTGRWGTIGSDEYGIGPGARAIPDIKRMQQMEKAFLTAVHKSIDPPLQVPSRLKNKLSSLPGGRTYTSNPADVVKEMYQMRFDYAGVNHAIERVEQRIQRNFFNDIFLTAARDPNATPYKATEVNAREQEKMLRLGPVIERLQHEYLQPLLERCFNIMLRKEKFEPLSPDLARLAGDYTITLISPLATAQRAVALNGIQSFLAFVGQAAQFDRTALDKVNIDMSIDEFADITGVDLGIIRPEEEVKKLRSDRNRLIAAENKRRQDMETASLQSQVDSAAATTQKTQSEAGLNFIEGQQAAIDAGIL